MPNATRRRLTQSLCVAAGWSALGQSTARMDSHPLPKVAVGTVVRLPMMDSREVPPRPVDVWVPPGVTAHTPVQVLVMHDGQMLFDASITWNRQAWNVHRAVYDLMQAGHLAPTLVVGVHNREGQRYAEYFPEKALAFASAAERAEYIRDESTGRPLADAYLRHLVREVLPAIGQRWTVNTGPGAIATAGASMGGLISWYALCEYPEVFHGAGCLSTHWLGRGTGRGLDGVRNEELPTALTRYLEQHLPTPGRHRLWLDRGDDALDSLYAFGLQRAGAVLSRKGWSSSQGTVRVFPGTGHNEADWSARIGSVVRYLFAG